MPNPEYKTATEIKALLDDKEAGMRSFVAELWSKEMIEHYEKVVWMYSQLPKRSYGEKLLRAAAKGEDWRKIKRYDDDILSFTRPSNEKKW